MKYVYVTNLKLIAKHTTVVYDYSFTLQYTVELRFINYLVSKDH